MTVVSMCYISLARIVRMPTFGLAGCTRSRGRRQPNFRTKLYQVDGDAQTLPSRCAKTARVPVGTCRYSTAVTMSLIARISAGVSRWGDVCGQDDRSSSVHACCRRRQAWNRLGENPRNRRSARNGTNARARSTARKILILAGPSGRRSWVNRNPEVRSSATASRRSAVSFFTRRRSTGLLAGAPMRSGSSRPGLRRRSVPWPAILVPSSAGCRDPWRWSRLRCVGQEPEAGGRSAAGGVLSSSSR